MKQFKHTTITAFRYSGVCLIAAVLCMVFLLQENSFAQQRIAHVQPDAVGPGMTIAMEVLAPAKDTGAFGSDGIYLPFSKIFLVNPADSFFVIFGPIVVSWNGRVLQVPVIAKTSAVPGTIRFQIIIGNKKSQIAEFEIRQPQSKISISGGATLGDPSFALFSFNGAGNTIVADEIEFLGSDIKNRGLFTFSKEDNDTLAAGNPHYHPVTLLSRGPIHLRLAEISVSADSLNGGPGGGGGGAGFSSTGGAGYTGGGSDSDYSSSNIGSGTNSTPSSGGASSTGILGGASSFIAPNIDQGGGGGAGCPYGSSGIYSGGNDTSHEGGYGGGSAGGETPGVPFGGGGGAFANEGTRGAGVGINGGKAYGGKFLIPMQGGSGGGGGNHVGDIDTNANPGSGGGGGGALTLISFDTLSIVNSFLSANGTSGTSGISSNDAGGGGGSGGGLILSGRNGISVNNAFITANGGSGGLGGKGIEQISKGGVGSFGRIRIDGNIHTPIIPNSFFSSTPISGPTLEIPSLRLNGPFVSVKGTAGDSISLTDSMRIYYRNQHSAWNFINTPRFGAKGNMLWQAFLPAGHDSSLFVTVMAEIKNPARSFANFEPERLLSHLSSGIIRLVPTPHLVLDQDTLIFGCYKIGDTCVNANFYFSNQGEDSLHIKSITISNTNFTVGQTKKDLGYYLTDSVSIKYCPTKVGKDTAILSFISNDTLRTAVVIGCGIDKDTRITLKPTTLDFGRVHIGKCDTLSLVAHSVGKDSALLSINPVSHAPFAIISPTKDTLIAPKDSVRIQISFCPNDTGDFYSSFILTEKRDSVKIHGVGIRKVLIGQEVLQGKRLCIGECDTIKVKISSLGNDAVNVTGISGATFVSQTLPFVIPPQTDTEFTIRYCAAKKGDTSVIISFASDADSSNSTILHYYGIHEEFRFDSVLNFGSLCPGSTDSKKFIIYNMGADSILIGSLQLLHGLPFKLTLDSTSVRDSLRSTVEFTPTISGQFNDTLLSVIHGQCGDSILRIPISGIGLNGDLTFSKISISFGVLDTSSCKDDSIIVTNPCNNIALLKIPAVVPPFYIKPLSQNTISLNPFESKTIVYSYCPKIVNADSTKQIFTLSSGAFLSVSLFGAGLPIVDSPFVKFGLERATETAGNTFTYLISVDTISSSTNIRSVQGSLHYDPTLVEPLSMSGIKWNISNNSETIPGTYVFSANGTDVLTKGQFATLQMMALYGATDTTSVLLDNIIVSNYARTAVDSGFIKVIHCGNLPGNVIIAGAYHLGNPTPNPTNGNISFPLTLGNDGVLRLRLFSVSGMVVLDKSIASKRGENTIVLDVSLLSSGAYYLSTDSWGWREGKTIVITK